MRVVSREDSLKIDELRAKYPEYFELGTFKGLEVYVWQMAENDYRFGLMQGTNREKTLEEKMALQGATAEEMALILSTFDIEDNDIFVIPWQNPISSYMVTEEQVKIRNTSTTFMPCWVWNVFRWSRTLLLLRQSP